MSHTHGFITFCERLVGAICCFRFEETRRFPFAISAANRVYPLAFDFLDVPTIFAGEHIDWWPTRYPLPHGLTVDAKPVALCVLYAHVVAVQAAPIGSTCTIKPQATGGAIG